MVQKNEAKYRRELERAKKEIEKLKKRKPSASLQRKIERLESDLNEKETMILQMRHQLQEKELNLQNERRQLEEKLQEKDAEIMKLRETVNIILQQLDKLSSQPELAL